MAHVQLAVVATAAQRAAAAALTPAAVAAQDAARYCHQVCDEVATKTREAQEAAACCVAARDNAAAAAELVGRENVVFRTILSSLRQARVRRHTPATAAGEANADHADARSAAKAAALAAREASVRCAAERRGAAAAASAARQAVQVYVTAGCDTEAEVKSKAEIAANLCLEVLGDNATEADRATAARRAVPRADAVAAAARQAAAICEEALGDSAAEDDKKFLDNMRGWLMTVAALLVNMTFTAILRPPAWVPLDFGLDYILSGNMFRRKTVSIGSDYLLGANVPAAAPSPGPAEDTTKVWLMASLYLMLNTFTFAAAISLVIALLNMGKRAPAKTLGLIRNLTRLLAFGAACSFVSGTSKDLRIVTIVSGIVFSYVCAVLYRVKTVGYV